MRGEYGVYEVIGGFDYRGHSKGTVFTARLAPNPERRAIERGTIRLIERRKPTIERERLRIAESWLA